MSEIEYEDFTKVDIRSGVIVKAEEFPRARKPAYKIWADFGDEIGVLQTSAQVTVHYDLESLKGKQIMGCINLGEKNIAGFKSQFLLLGCGDQDGAICLLSVDAKAGKGSRME